MTTTLRRSRIPGVLLLLAIFTLLSATDCPAFVNPARASQPQPLRFWVSPEGSDDASGLASTEPLSTLGEVQLRLCPTRPCTPLGQDVQVILLPGQYRFAHVRWGYTDPNHRVQVIGPRSPLHPRYGQGDAILDGGRSVAYGIVLDGRDGIVAGFELHGVTMQRYVLAALYLIGPAMAAVGANRVQDSVFRDIGNAQAPGVHRSWGAILSARVNGLHVDQNRFEDILNAPDDGIGHEHAVYLINSSDAVLRGNVFRGVGGDAIRFRDRSDGNLVEANVFVRAGGHGFVGDWYCGPRKVASGECGPVEFRSRGNVLAGNRFISTFERGLGRVYRQYCHDLRRPCPTDRIRQAR